MTREEIMKNPEVVEVIKDALEKGVVIEGFTLEEDKDDDGLVTRPTKSKINGYLGFAMMASAMSSLVDSEYTVHDITKKHTKKIDIYRKYVPNPDAQPINEKCKCGSGKKYKHCCIKK